jgi:hypothetical protein
MNSDGIQDEEYKKFTNAETELILSVLKEHAKRSDIFKQPIFAF